MSNPRRAGYSPGGNSPPTYNADLNAIWEAIRRLEKLVNAPRGSDVAPTSEEIWSWPGLVAVTADTPGQPWRAHIDLYLTSLTLTLPKAQEAAAQIDVRTYVDNYLVNTAFISPGGRTSFTQMYYKMHAGQELWPTLEAVTTTNTNLGMIYRWYPV